MIRLESDILGLQVALGVTNPPELFEVVLHCYRTYNTFTEVVKIVRITKLVLEPVFEFNPKLGLSYPAYQWIAHSVTPGENLRVCAKLASLDLLDFHGLLHALRQPDRLLAEGVKLLKEGEPYEIKT